MATKQSDKARTKEGTELKAESRAKESKALRRSAKTEEKDVQAHKEKRKDKQTGIKARVRIFPVWLRLIIVCILSVAALMAGLMIGYGVIGDGTPTDALKVETWQHIIDIVVKEK